MLPFRPDEADLSQMAKNMQSAMQNVVTIEVTTATRAVELDGVEVAQGQAIGLVDGKLRVAAEDSQAVLERILETLDMEAFGLLSLYYGQAVHPAEAEALVEVLQNRFDQLEIELYAGGQPTIRTSLG
ncbi:MAG: hypothetical protein HC915_16945 [Anaerolineae bacterium]|nr:hypothetical protein [Anaerolineae bacterium]